jgi:hypothetical protein
MLYARPDEPAKLALEAYVRGLIIKGERNQDQLTAKARLYLKKREGKGQSRSMTASNRQNQFKAFIGWRVGRWICYSLASGGRKFTSCSPEMRTISATSVKLCSRLNSASSFCVGDTQNSARAGLSDLLK